MPLPTDAELPPIYLTDAPEDRNASNTARRECRKKGTGPDLSALRFWSLIQYARKRGLTDLNQICDKFIAEWRRPYLKRSGQQMGTAISANLPSFVRRAETT
jgi:hypothetical protein